MMMDREPELGGEASPGRLAGALGQTVGAVAGEPRCRFVVAQPGRVIDTEALGGAVGGVGMPG